MKTIVTTSFEETQQLGKDFAAQLKSGGVIALHGDLGSGKTTFTQGFAQGLGIEQRIISPTFIIMRTYELARHSGKRSASRISYRSNQSDPGHGQDDGLDVKHFYHVDLYRIETERDVEGLGLFELMQDPENIVVIEWPEKIEHLLPEKRIDLFFEYTEGDKRKISFA